MGFNTMAPELVVPRNVPYALVENCDTTPVPVVVALPFPLPKVTVSRPVLGLTLPVRESSDWLAGKFVRILFAPTAILKVS